MSRVDGYVAICFLQIESHHPDPIWEEGKDALKVHHLKPLVDYVVVEGPQIKDGPESPILLGGCEIPQNPAVRSEGETISISSFSNSFCTSCCRATKTRLAQKEFGRRPISNSMEYPSQIMVITHLSMVIEFHAGKYEYSLVSWEGGGGRVLVCQRHWQIKYPLWVVGMTSVYPAVPEER